MARPGKYLRPRAKACLALATLLVLIGGCAQLDSFHSTPSSPAVARAADLIRKNDTAGAIREFDKAIAADRNNVDVYRDIILICASAGKLDLVVQYGEMANSATSRAPADKRAEILRVTGAAYLTIASTSDPNTRAINTAKAIEFNEAALKLKPNDPGFMNDLGYSYAEHYDLSMPGAAKLQDALRLTRTAVTQARSEGVSERDLGMYVDSLGWVYYKLQDYDQAVANLSRAADLAPGVKEIHLHLAQALHAKGRTDDALVELEKALRIDPGYQVAIEQLRTWKGSASPGQRGSGAPPAAKPPSGPSSGSGGRPGPVTQTVGPSPLLRPRP